MIKLAKKYINYVLLSLIVLFVIGAAFMGYYIGLYVQKDNYADFLKSFKNIRENSDKYTFINPLIGGMSAPATDVGIYSDIQGTIQDYLKNEVTQGNLYTYSFYFRDMGTGLWFGIHETSDFFPASLFKLPIAIAVYKEAENDPTFLKKTAVYTQDIATRNSSIKLNSQSSLVVGKSYSVEDLVVIMLTASDNGAKDLLLSQLDIKYLNQLFSVVALIDPQSVKTYQISSRKYALFLRILYGSSYLNEEHSELLLKILSKSEFKDGLVAGVPAEVVIAHKFGAYEFQEDVNGKSTLTQQLHDCGIVYHAQKPYIFCLMTKGKDSDNLYRIISHVSKLIYDNQEADLHEDDN